MNNKHKYQIRRSQRAKRARIVVTADKVEVVAPLRMSEKQIKQFMQDKLSWVENAKNKVQQHVDQIASFAPQTYQQGVLVPYQGRQFKLNIKAGQEDQVRIGFDSAFTANVPASLYASLTAGELSDRIRLALIGWMAKSAVEQAEKTLNRYVPLYQLHPRSITIKTQKSRWGSCGIHDDINLNWLLILAPVEVFEYVVIHELCHIAERNHSAAFWTLVARHCPAYQQQRGWLKRHGSSLMLGL